jgi:hypothetical protein
MKRILLIVFALSVPARAGMSDDLQNNFVTPPDSAKAHT